MGDEVSWVFEVSVKPDRLEEFKALAREMTEANAAAEPDMLIYDWFVDGLNVHVCERYRNSAAALLHVQRFGANFAERLFGLSTFGRITIYGDASDGLKSAAAELKPVFMTPITTYART
jgi:quinol monooxygenase YgiN